jgi:uncharacterized membrane protein YbhN (UPF0104 family)
MLIGYWAGGKASRVSMLQAVRRYTLSRPGFSRILLQLCIALSLAALGVGIALATNPKGDTAFFILLFIVPFVISALFYDPNKPPPFG